MSLFQNHSRKILGVMLLGMSIGCQPGHLSDVDLSERMTAGSASKAAVIYLLDGNYKQGFFVALQSDSLEWHEGASLETKRHTITADSVQKVLVQGPTPYWAPVFGLGGCALGGCSACFVVAGSSGELTTNKVATAMGIGAVAGAAAGYGIGLLSDPGRTENAWVYKIHKRNSN